MAKRFTRPKRKKPAVPKPYVLQPKAPSVMPKPERRNIWLMILPVMLVVGVIGTVIVMFVMRGGATGYIFPGITMFSMVGYAVMSGGRFGRRQKRSSGQREEDRREYLSDLDDKRDRNQENSRLLFEEDRRANTSPAQLVKLVGGERMWERRPTDPDFLDVRIGVGVQEKDQGIFRWEEIELPQNDELEPVSGKALQDFMLVQTKILGMGKVVNLRSKPGFSLIGDRDVVTGLTRSVLCEIAAYHSPAEVKIAVVSHRPQLWDWVKWLPHSRHRSLVDACGRRRLFFESPEELEDVLADDIHSRPVWSPLAMGEGDFPAGDSPMTAASTLETGDALKKQAEMEHWIVVDDNSGSAIQWEGITGKGGFAGVTFLRLAELASTGVGFDRDQIFEVRDV